MIALGIAVAGAVGAPARYLLDATVQERLGRVFPWGTFVINVTGSFLLGLLSGAALYHAFPGAAKSVLGTGFCGAYTTFSTFAYETHRLAEERSRLEAVLNVVTTTVGCLVGAAAGLALTAAV